MFFLPLADKISSTQWQLTCTFLTDGILMGIIYVDSFTTLVW